MLATGLRTIQALLIATAVYFGYATLSPIVRATTIQETVLPDMKPTPPSTRELSEFSAIANRNLFHSQAADPLQLPDEDRLEESKLEMALRGTTVTTPAERSTATVQDLRRNETEVLGIGDKIENIEVVRIERRRIVLNNNGRLEQLSFDDDAAAAMQQASARARSNRLSLPNAATGRRPSPVSDRRAPGPTMRNLPINQGNSPLEEGEQIRFLNGIDITDPSKLDELVESLTGETVEVTIERPDGTTRIMEDE